MSNKFGGCEILSTLKSDCCTLYDLDNSSIASTLNEGKDSEEESSCLDIGVNSGGKRSATRSTLSIRANCKEDVAFSKNKKSRGNKAPVIPFISNLVANSSWEGIAAEAKMKEIVIAEKKYIDMKKHDDLDYKVKLMTKYKELKSLGFTDKAIVEMMPDMETLTKMSSNDVFEHRPDNL